MGFAQAQTTEAIRYEANRMMQSEQYHQALPLWLKLIRRDQEDTDAHLNAGICYMHSDYQLHQAEKHLFKVYENENYKKRHPEVCFWLGKYFQLQMEFDNALKNYIEYRDLINDKLKIKKTDKYIIECENGGALKAKAEQKLITKPIPPLVNTSYDEYAPVISYDKAEFYFASNRPPTPSRLILSEGQAIFMPRNAQRPQTYLARSNFEPGMTEPPTWEVPPDPDPVFGEPDITPLCISSDKQYMLVLRRQGQQEGIYISERDNQKWSKPKRLSRHLVDDYPIRGACFAEGGRVIYFSSERPDGIGGFDLYKCEKDGKRSWTKPQLLGPQINSPFDETYPYMHPNNLDFYFSSNQVGSMGGMDIFHTKLIGHFQKPLNMGVPINSAFDETQFVKLGSMDMYFTSNRQNNQSVGAEDLYVAYYPEKQNPLSMVTGKITCTRFGQPVPVKMSVVQMPNEIPQKYLTQPQARSGTYLLVAQPGNYYRFQLDLGNSYQIQYEINLHDSTVVYHMNQHIEIGEIKVAGSTIGERPQITSWSYHQEKLSDTQNDSSARYTALITLMNNFIQASDSAGLYSLDQMKFAPTSESDTERNVYYDPLFSQLEYLISIGRMDLMDSAGKLSATLRGMEGSYTGVIRPETPKSRIIKQIDIAFIGKTSEIHYPARQELDQLIRLTKEDQSLKLMVSVGSSSQASEQGYQVIDYLASKGLRPIFDASNFGQYRSEPLQIGELTTNQVQVWLYTPVE